VDLALAQRGVDDTAPALAQAHARVEFRQVPSLADFGARVGDERRAHGIVRQIVALAWVMAQVEELVGVGRRRCSTNFWRAMISEGSPSADSDFTCTGLKNTVRAGDVTRLGTDATR
jgi:hypothetical protein